MITRVLNAKGEVVHDCLDAGCDVSWDGYAIRDGVTVPNPRAGAHGEPDTLTLAEGDPLPGREDPPDGYLYPDGRTAQMPPPELPE